MLPITLSVLPLHSPKWCDQELQAPLKKKKPVTLAASHFLEQGRVGNSCFPGPLHQVKFSVRDTEQKQRHSLLGPPATSQARSPMEVSLQPKTYSRMVYLPPWATTCPAFPYFLFRNASYYPALLGPTSADGSVPLGTEIAALISSFHRTNDKSQGIQNPAVTRCKPSLFRRKGSLHPPTSCT